MAGSVVWVDVLPSGSKYGPAIEKIAVSGAAKAGNSAGAALDDGLAKGAKGGGGAAKFFGGVAKAGLRATGVLTTGVVGVGAAIATVAAKKGFDRLVEIDSAQKKLSGLKMTTKDIGTVMDSALASVKGTAFGLGEAATVASSAVAAGIKPGKDLTKYLKLTADAASIAGTSLGDMGSIINQTTTSGKVYTDSLNQLADRGIPIFQWLQKEYGVSADDLTKMVKKGQVDSATFRKVIEENIGGAALRSGDSFVGAYANMGAALGRLGAMFGSGAIAAAPKLFSAITGVLDRTGVALKPVSDAFGVFVETRLNALSDWLNGVDPGPFIGKMVSIGGAVKSALSIAASGDASGTKAIDLYQLFGLHNGLAVVAAAQRVHDGVAGALDVAKILGGDSSNGTAANLAKHFGLDAAPTIYKIASQIHDSLSQMFAGIKTGDIRGLGGSLTDLLPAFQAFGAELPNIGGAVGKLAGAGITLLTGALGFLADHVDTIIKWMPLIVAGFVAWQIASRATVGATLALRTAELIAIPAQIYRNVLRLEAARLEYAMARATAVNTAVTNQATGATGRMTIAQTILSAALRGGAIATNIGALALRGFGLAVRFAMGPVGIIIGIIGLLVAGLVWFFTQTKLGQAIVSTVFTAIQTAAVAVGNAFVWLWQNAVAPALAFIGDAVSYLWSSYVSPIFQLIGAIVVGIGKVFAYLWTGYVSPIFQLIGAIFSWLWSSIIQPVGAFVIGMLVDGIGAGISWLYNNVVKPVFGLIGAVFSAWWNGIVKPVFGFVIGLIQNTLGPVFSWLYNSIIAPVFSKIGSVVQATWNGFLKPIFDKIVDVAKVVVPAAFTAMKDGIATAFDLISTVVKAPIKFVVDTVINGAIIGNFNKLADFFKTDKMPPVALPKGFARGGVLGGYGSAKSDTTLTPMRAGEGVLVPEVVRALGPGFVHGLNRLGNRGVRAVRAGTGYATGGIVGAATGAWDWISGKAGSAWDWAKDAASTAASVVSDPMGTLGKLVNGVIGKIPGAGGMLDVAKGIGGKILDGAISKIKGLASTAAGVFGGNGQNGQIPSSALAPANGFAPGPGVGASGGLLQRAAAAAWNAAQTASGGILKLTEGYRDLKAQQYRWGIFQRGGNLAAAPGTSIHGLGDAADVAGGQSWLRSNGARFGWQNTGLGFSQREPWHFEFKGAPAGSTSTGGRGGVPLYDDGGMLPRGLSLVANKTSKPEAVLTGEQWRALTARAGRDGGEVHFHYEGREFTQEDYMEAEHRQEVLRG